ncbi:DarT ssDNA thymidine ADP-ribosyltransferase family protein [Xanthomonas nasturtii]|uniref:DarT ssDNA thymidine ADP-ribosyltransferase family protein n=1 Tax=Xanthomonas nasturtii TaxID=1843581 RepID=UPI003CE5A1BD
MPGHYPNLNPKKALIWRIVHRDNLPWILENGLHCGNGAVQSADWVNIGNQELIDKRANHPVPIVPGGFLSDYAPFILHSIFTDAAQHQYGPGRRPTTVERRNCNTCFQPASRRCTRMAFFIH